MRSQVEAAQIFNKIVRDKIPDIIKAEGRSVVTKILSDDEALIYLKKKLCEEVDEFLASDSLHELADIVEVVRALASALGSNASSVEAIRKEKRLKNGGFGRRILLLSAGSKANLTESSN
jgi:predicted house-cleaning noncanonical NTP pyrophosphatase (MazG superfamily)